MTLFYILLACLIVSLTSFAGGIFLFWGEQKVRAWLPYLVSLAAGMMLGAAFLDLLPEAFNKAPTHQPVLMAALFGIVIFFFLERFVLWFHHHDDTHGAEPTSVLILVGDGLHNFIDGITIAAAFLVNPMLGLAATIAIATHEIPQEMADLSVLLHSGMKISKALFFNFLSALTAFAGAIAAYLFLAGLQTAIPYFLAFAAGMFIYISCSDLIPDLHKDFKQQKKWTRSIPFILGIIILWVIIRLVER